MRCPIGQQAVNVEPDQHGQPGHPYSPKVRLHYGDESIDETHTMTKATLRALVGYRAASNTTSFATTFDSWFDGVASSAAAVFKSDFRSAAWAAW